MLQIYKESAGSGKTYKLAYEYIRLLIGHRDPDTGIAELYKSRDNHKKILAITFTNKATNEMKRRIMHELALLAGMESNWGKRTSKYLNDLTKFYNTTPEKIASVAREALYNLIFDFSNFHISTIDAFFQLVLRTFAREAELTGNYEVELDSKFAIKVGIDGMLNSIVRNPSDKESARVVKWISDYLLRESEEGSFKNIFDRSGKFYGALISFISNISDEKFAEEYDKMMTYLSDPTRLTRFRAGLYAIIDSKKKRVVKAAGDFSDYYESLAEEPGLQSNLVKAIVKWVEYPEELPTLSKTIQKVRDNIEDAYKAAGRKKREKYGADDHLDSLIISATDAIIDIFTVMRLFKAAAENVFVLGLIERIYHFIAEYRSENNLILLSDTNSLLHKIIGDDEAPFIYERVGVWYRHFLIDEFQDTSGMQWANLRPLVTESLSTDQDNLIIGDEKQCIYRFRDSDPSLLGTQIQKQFSRYLSPDYNPLQGNTNWRSSADIVEFNNNLFAVMALQNGYNDIYANVVQEIAPKQKNHPGYVIVRMIDKELNAEDKDSESDNYCQPVSDIPPEDIPLEIMSAEIDRQLRSGYSGGEIAILTRRVTEAARCIEYLERKKATDPGFYKDFRIISDDSMLLSSSAAVRLVVSILRLINSENKKTIVESPTETEPSSSFFPGIGKAEEMINRYEYFFAGGYDPNEALSKSLSDESVMIDLPLSTSTDNVPVFSSFPSLVECIIMRYLSEEVRESENMYISAFQDAVIDFCSKGTNDIYSFLQWWDNNSSRLTVSAPEEKNAIRVMTIHKSKGLEFKCVHIPFANWELYSDKSYEWFDPIGFEDYKEYIKPEDIPPILPFKPSGMEGTPFEEQFRNLRKEQILDELNVTYVAFTRAIDELHIIYNSPSVRYIRKESGPRYISDLIFDAVNSEVFLSKLGHRITEREDDIIRIGHITRATIEDTDPPTALEPQELVKMVPYISHQREEIWNDTKIDEISDIIEGAPRERGLVLHDIMANISDITSLHSTVIRLQRQGIIPADETEKIEHYLDEAIATVADFGWFSGYKRVMSRKRFITRKGYTTTADRVVWTADGHVDIIDYRFGEEDERHKSHMSILKNIMSTHTREPIRGFVWYLDKNKLIRV